MNAPFRSQPRTVLPDWIDYNGHLNMAYYSVLMDNAVDDAYAVIGFDDAYRASGFTTYVVEFHICYLRELHEGHETYCTFQLLDFSPKKFHSFVHLYHADGWLAATGEALTLHIDQSGPRAAPMPETIQNRLREMKTAHAALPLPDRAGRRISLNP